MTSQVSDGVLPLPGSELPPRDHESLRPSTPTCPKRSSSILDAPGQLQKPTSLGTSSGEPQITTPTIVLHTDDAQSPSKISPPKPLPSRSSSLLPSAPIYKTRPATSGDVNGRRADFLNLKNPIPTGSLVDLSADRVKFSNRGSLILLDANNQSSWRRSPRQGDDSTSGSPRKRVINGRKAALKALASAQADAATDRDDKAGIGASAQADGLVRSSRVMSADEASLSRRVRAMYDIGSDDPFVDHTLLEEDEDVAGSLAPSSNAPSQNTALGSAGVSRSPSRAQHRLPHETAGGIEDWQDVKSEEVDRYGFILSSGTDQSSRSSAMRTDGATPRVSTPLLEVSNSPRKRGVLRRIPSRSSTVGTNGNDDDTPRRRASRRSVNPQGSIYSSTSRRSVSRRQNSIRSPLASRDRKLMVDAADMLTLPPGLSEFGTNGRRVTPAAQQKERDREIKWKKMAKLQPGSKNGSGMHFHFDTTDPKVISRTWKGIPDRWRATAWYSFLESSAKKHRGSASSAQLMQAFRNLQLQDSADDVQIDMDVPRTINRHIMFRRRYRGGQRLLFRVLHALSLHFPEVGYVQGMAALAATLLCYQDEEHTFVMMVRLWQLRGLQRLYESGFEGLMDALGEFEKEWLRDGDVAKKLEELGIHCTAYGTRWYLTLFNYSIPFPAQLRVWDVFMLLGDKADKALHLDSLKSNATADLDVLHATSAALMDATREVILDADFENAMKVLTSWIPIKDEDLLMKVAHAEWKQRKRRLAR